jgi:hypothetical protein
MQGKKKRCLCVVGRSTALCMYRKHTHSHATTHSPTHPDSRAYVQGQVHEDPFISRLEQSLSLGRNAKRE